jgi:hypothetical protein
MEVNIGAFEQDLSFLLVILLHIAEVLGAAV